MNKCSKCGQPATHKFIRIANHEAQDLFLCPQHAAELSPYQKPVLSELIEGLLKQENIKAGPGGGVAGKGPGANVRCPDCQLTFEAYRSNYILGCSGCYAAFREFMVNDLRKFHGGARHVGRRPGGGKALPLNEGEAARPLSAQEKLKPEAPAVPAAPSRAKLLVRLEEKLRSAIAQEDFAEAARFRDEIHKLKAGAEA